MKPLPLAPPVKDLYDQDFVEWTVRNAELLRAGRLDEIDIEHLAEEIEDMGKSQQRELESRLVVLLAHLLKWRTQPEGRGSSWRSTVNTQRREIRRMLGKMPSLGRHLEQSMPEAYADAVGSAADETSLPKTAFPKSCPFTRDQIMDEEFFPR